jgi:hypothetical protein
MMIVFTCVGIKNEKFEATWTKRKESSSFTVLLSCATFDRDVLGDWMREGGEVVIRIKIASGCQRASGPVFCSTKDGVFHFSFVAWNTETINKQQYQGP